MTAHATEPLLRIKQRGAHPALGHGPTPPALDVAGVGLDGAVETLDQVGRAQGAVQRPAEPEPGDGERLIESLPQRGRRPRVLALQRVGQGAEPALGECGAGLAPRLAQGLVDARLQGLGQVIENVAPLVLFMPMSA